MVQFVLVQGVIDGTHIYISKPKRLILFQNWWISIIFQCVIDCKKIFIDVFVGLTNNASD